MSSLTVDQEFIEALAPILQGRQNVPKPKVHDVEGRRALFASFKAPPPTIPSGVTFKILEIPRADGTHISVYHLRQTQLDTSTPRSSAVIHMHGGGFIALSPDINVERLSRTVQDTGVQAFSVDYRLAPEHPYPAALDDCWATLEWLRSNAQSLHVDPARIGVMGESAGGGLAAALTIRARDTGLKPPIARQILCSPMLDDRTTGEAPGDFKLWDAADNVTGWTAYLGKPPGGDGVSMLAAPGRLTDASGLPKLYLDTSQFDLFIKENLSYVQKFVEAGVEVEAHVYPGLPHGFDGMLPNHSVTLQLESNRKRILKGL